MESFENGAGRELCGYPGPPERGTRVTRGINDKMGLSYSGHVMRRQAMLGKIEGGRKRGDQI